MPWELEVGPVFFWNAIQEAARKRGVLVYAIDLSQIASQPDPEPLDNVDPIDPSGYRFGLAAKWISLAYQGKDFPFSGQVCQISPREANVAKTTKVIAADWISYWKAVTKVFSGTVSGLKGEHAHAPSAAFICQVVFRAYGCYGVTLEGPNVTHSVAMCNGRDGRLHLFDANYFHMAIKNPDAFQSFVSWWLEKTGYRNQFTQRTGVVGIRPPINHKHP
jgi:hypothetical protein